MTLNLRPTSLAALLFSGLAFFSGGPGGGAFAQEVSTERSFDGDLFQPAIGPRNFLTVDAPEVPLHKQLSFGLSLDFQRHPYRINATDQNTGLSLAPSYPIQSQIKSDLQGALGLFDQFQLGIDLPITLSLKGDQIDPAQGLPLPTKLSAAGIGDLRLEVKGQILSAGDDDQFLLAALLGATLPTGDSSAYLGEKGPTGRAKALASIQLGALRVGGQLGVLLRQTSTTLGVPVGNQLLYGGAASYRALKKIDVLAEIVGRSGLNDFRQRWWDENPVEADLAGRAYPTGMLALTVGVGAGLGKGIGSPAARVFVGVTFTPDFRDADKDGVYDTDDRCPDQPEDRDGFNDADGCPDPDNDGDGIPDILDKCPNDPEDFDQFEDADGCPELDNDKDGIPDLNDPCPNAAEDGRGKRPKDGCPSSSEDSDGDGISDAVDKCPDEPEDRDGFEDADGCPDPDNDGDGIPDGFDNCPNEPEDADSFEDDDGCPDPDNDKDGIPDAADKCPNDAETLNLIQDDDGCPDAGAEVVQLEADRIRVTESLPFTTRSGQPELKPLGVSLVHLVAMVLKGHPELRKVAIEVHSEKLGKEATARRAEIIRDAIVQQGVAAGRLVAVGAGGGAGNGVEFHITEKAPARPESPVVGAPAPAVTTPPATPDEKTAH